MTHSFRSVNPDKLEDNVFKAIGRDWMLVTAGTPVSYNTMTASWGAWGILWNKKIAICFVRPQRYTHQFLEKSDHFTLSFFPSGMRRTLNYCGTHTGRDVDKAAATGLTPIAGEADTVYFAEARLVMVCRKIYFQDLDPRNFLTPEIQAEYPQEDYHRVFLGEIVNCLRRKTT